MTSSEASGSPPTVVLGTGSDAAAASALHGLLIRKPTFVMGHSKAYHVFDALDLDRETGCRERQMDLAAAALEDLREQRTADAAALHRLSMIGNPALYFDYVAGLLRREEGKRLTADLTAEYALLSAGRLNEIDREFDARSVRVVPVYVMRDLDTASSAGRLREAFGDRVIVVPQQLLDGEADARLDAAIRSPA